MVVWRNVGVLDLAAYPSPLVFTRGPPHSAKLVGRIYCFYPRLLPCDANSIPPSKVIDPPRVRLTIIHNYERQMRKEKEESEIGRNQSPL